MPVQSNSCTSQLALSTLVGNAVTKSTRQCPEIENQLWTANTWRKRVSNSLRTSTWESLRLRAQLHLPVQTAQEWALNWTYYFFCHCYFTSTETVRTITVLLVLEKGCTGRPPRLSHSSWAPCSYFTRSRLLGAGLTRVTSTMYTYIRSRLYSASHYMWYVLAQCLE